MDANQDVFNLDEYMALQSDNTTWIWRGVLPYSGSALLFGDAKTGKSKLALSLAEAIADESRIEYLGLDVCEHGKVLYIQLDTPRALWKENYISIIKPGPARQGIYTVDREVATIPTHFDIRRQPEHDWVRRKVDAIKPILVVIDTVIKLHKGNENESDTISQVIDSFISATLPSALLYLTHKKKQQAGEAGNGTVRGSSAFAGAVDALINMSKTKLHIEARSDVQDEIAIVQLADGTFQLNSREDEITEFLATLPPTMPAGKMDLAVAEQFKVTTRTAKTWRLANKEQK